MRRSTGPPGTTTGSRRGRRTGRRAPPQDGYRRVTQELHGKEIPVNHKRIHRLLQIVLAGDKADLRALLLKRREPEPFELLRTDFTLLPYRVRGGLVRTPPGSQAADGGGLQPDGGQGEFGGGELKEVVEERWGKRLRTSHGRRG